MPLRIGIVSDYYYPQLGGITEQVHGQATELTRRGHEVTVIAPKLLVVPRTVDPEPPPANFEIRRVGLAYPFYVNGSESLMTLSPRIPFALDRLFGERRFDILHVHNPFGVLVPMSAIMRSQASVTIATTHSVVPTDYRPLRALARPVSVALRRVDAHIADSDAVVDSIRPYFPELEYEVIANGVDTSFFSPDAEPLPRLADQRNILFVGRFDPRNGLKHMLEAFVELRSRRSDVRLVVLGNGPLRPLIKRLVPPELATEVRFEGRINRLRPRYLASADIFCTPCRLASFGMVILEAMSSGTPVVATRLPGFAEVMQDGVHGLMVDEPDDTAGFASALDTLLDDPQRARALGQMGRERVLATFSWPRIGDSLEELYMRQLAARKASFSTSMAGSIG